MLTELSALHGRYTQPHRPIRFQARADQPSRPPSDFGELVETFQYDLAPSLKPLFDFRPHGSCGKMLGEPSHRSRLRLRHRFHPQHRRQDRRPQPGDLLQTTVFHRPGFPAMRSWFCYGLGRLTDNLPAFVVLPDHPASRPTTPKTGTCLPVLTVPGHHHRPRL